MGTAGGGQDFAFDGSVGDGEDLTVARRSEDAVIASAALGEGDVCEIGDEVEVIALVCCVRTGAGGLGWGKVVVVGVAGGADAGCSVESVYFEAGVVGDDDFAGGAGGVVDGLEAGVAFEGGFVFGGGGDLFEAGERSQCDLLRCRGGEVSELAGVGRGYVEIHLATLAQIEV